MLIQHPATRVLTAALFLLAACGGGGDGTDAPPVQVPSYSIGGTITGLSGSVTLQNNGGESLTVNANGAFNFTTRVSSGGAYAVTVSSQPLGPDCTVGGGSGAATGNVSGVTVTCTVNPATRYVALRAELPVSFESTGLYVLSNKLVDRPLVRIHAGDTGSIALLAEHTLDGNGAVTGAKPGSLVYRTQGLAGGDNLWSLDLTGGSSLVPRQIGNLQLGWNTDVSVSRPQLCNQKTILRNLRDPDSAMHVLTLSESTPFDPTYGCTFQSDGTIGTRRVVVLATDTATTSPRTISVSQGNMEPIYLANGSLGGILVLNTQTQTLEFFRDETFTQPLTVLTDVAEFVAIPDALNMDTAWTDRGGKQTHAVIQVSHSNSSLLYRVSNTGTAQLLHDASAVVDYPVTRYGDDLFLTDRDLLVYPALYLLVRVPVEGSGGSQTLWSFQPEASCHGYFVSAVAGPRLWLVRTCFGGTAADTTAQLATLSRDTPGTPVEWASYNALIGDVSVVQDHVLVNLRNEVAGSAFPPVFHYSTEIRSSTGAVVQTRAPGVFAPAPAGPGNPLLQIRDSNGAGYGGGSLNRLTLSAPNAPALTRLTNVDGSAYSLPADTVDGFMTSISANTAFGRFWGESGGHANFVDLARGIVTTPVVPGTVLQMVTFEP